MSSEFAGKVALVTGGTRGIGLAVAAQLADGGAAVVINGTDPARGEAAVRQLLDAGNRRLVAFEPADIRDPQAVVVLCRRAVERYGSLDILINNARIQVSPGLFMEETPESIANAINYLLVSYLLCIHAAIPYMAKRGGGAIVSVGSDAARVGTPGEVLLSAGKGGVHSATKSLAAELSRYGIRVNAVSISLTAGTGGFEEVMAQAFSQQVFRKVRERMRLGVPTAEDVASAITFFCSPRAARITGQILSVNSGLSFPG